MLFGFTFLIYFPFLFLEYTWKFLGIQLKSWKGPRILLHALGQGVSVRRVAKQETFLGKLLEDYGTTPSAFARAGTVSVDPSTVFNWIKKKIPDSSMPQLADMLAVPVELVRSWAAGTPVPPKFRDRAAWAERLAAKAMSGATVRIGAATLERLEELARRRNETVEKVIAQLVLEELRRIGMEMKTPAPSGPASDKDGG